MSEHKTYKVTITAVMTSDGDPGMWALEDVIDDIRKYWMPTCAVEMESEELMDEERQPERISELEQETWGLRAERYKLKHLHEGPVKIIQDLRDRLKQKENGNDNV